MIALLEDAENGRLPGGMLEQVGHFHYRFARIHPFCDGNGRMARALSTLLHARIEPEILLFEKPVDEVILEHRDDYVSVLEFCDSFYEYAGTLNLSASERLRICSLPFVNFYLRAFTRAFTEHIQKLRETLAETGEAMPRYEGPLPELSADIAIGNPPEKLKNWND